MCSRTSSSSSSVSLLIRKSLTTEHPDSFSIWLSASGAVVYVDSSVTVSVGLPLGGRFPRSGGSCGENRNLPGGDGKPCIGTDSQAGAQFEMSTDSLFGYSYIYATENNQNCRASIGVYQIINASCLRVQQAIRTAILSVVYSPVVY